MLPASWKARHLVSWVGRADLLAGTAGRGWAGGGAHAWHSQPGSRSSAWRPGAVGSGPWQDVVFRNLQEREATMSSPV